MLELSADKRDWVPVEELQRLSTKVAVDYLGKTMKTVLRDIEKLKENGLILHKDRKVRANKQLILAFLPTRVRQGPGKVEGGPAAPRAAH